VGYFLFSLQTYFYLVLTRSLIGKYIEKFAKHVMIGVIVAGSLAYGFSLAIYSSSSRIAPFLAVHTTFTSILSIISLVASFSIFMGAKRAGADSQAKIIKIFALVYMIFFAWQLCLWLFPLQTLLLFSALNLLVLNVIPIPFLANLLKDRDKTFSLSPTTDDRVKAFYRKHGLSQRESEIADLILAGKSNEEIKDELFISVFTVKKHVSNIFMKLDINSRSQLNHMVMRAALPDLNEGEDSI
jgi:DNA-binding CsgD family transcriptional regulator